MTVSVEARDGDTWESRVRQVAAMIEDSMRIAILNPEDVVCNVVCNSCGRVAPGKIDAPPTGWTLGGFGENDYCPGCRNLGT